MGNDLNRIKVVLADHKKCNKWLANELGIDPATVLKWCTNAAQSGLETLIRIADLLDIDIRTLINPSNPTFTPEKILQSADSGSYALN